MKREDARLVGRSEQRERSGLLQDPWQEGFPWEGSCRDSEQRGYSNEDRHLAHAPLPGFPWLSLSAHRMSI